MLQRTVGKLKTMSSVAAAAKKSLPVIHSCDSRFALSFGGCGFLGIYHIGVLHTLHRHAPDVMDRTDRVAGASAGSLAALFAVHPHLLDHGKDLLFSMADGLRDMPLGALTPGYSLIIELEKLLNEYLPQDVHEVCSGKLHVSMTRVIPSSEPNKLVSEFTTRDHLIQCLLASCYIPGYAGIAAEIPKIDDESCVDGGLSNNLPTFDDLSTITVSPFSGSAHIAPTRIRGPLSLASDWDVTFGGQSFAVSMNNALRGAQALFPPARETLEMYYQLGCMNTLQYLKKHGMMERPDGSPNVPPVCFAGLDSILIGSGRSVHAVSLQGSLNFDSPVLQALVSESRSVCFEFTKIQDPSGPELLRITKMYRSILRAHMNEDAALRDLLGTMELVFSLCELLFVEPKTDETIAHDLIRWAAWNGFGIGLDDDVELMEDTKSYCDVLHGYALFGRVGDSLALLKQHSKWHTPVFQAAIQLLESMPSASAEQSTLFSLWQTECRRKLEENVFNLRKDLRILFSILSGDVQVLEEVKHLLPSWYQALVPYVLYQKRDILITSLGTAVTSLLQVFGQQPNWSALDEALVAAFEFDILTMITKLSECMPWWLPTHLVDILIAAGSRDLAEPVVDGRSLRDYLFVNYALSLWASDPQRSWSIAISYLDWCAVGQSYAARLLDTIAIESDEMADEILEACAARDLNSTARSICRRLGLEAMRGGDYNSALKLCLKADDSALAENVASRILLNYKKNSSLPIFDSEETLLTLSPMLTFLGKYRQFQRLISNRSDIDQLREAASILAQLVSTREAPFAFLPFLFDDSLELLNVKHKKEQVVVFDMEQLFVFLDAIESFSVPVEQADTAVGEYTMKELNILIKKCRECLLRNVSLSYVSVN